jgi:TPR repeat protein
MVNRGNRLRYVMWFVLAGVVVLLAVLIVAIAMDVQISTGASAAILVACGVVSAALIVSSSRLAAQRGAGADQSAESGQVNDPSAGNISNWMFLADRYVARQEYESAERFYRRAADAGHAPAMARLGEVLYELGRDDEAAYYREKAREVDD